MPKKRRWRRLSKSKARPTGVPGARMILSADGRSAGVINGGCLDADLWARAQHNNGKLARHNWRFMTPLRSQDIVFGLGLGCRGVVKILIEPNQPI